MLQKNKCYCDDNCFERSERLFKDKMDTWTCGCHQYEEDYSDYREDYFAKKPNCPQRPDSQDNDMALAMAYVKKQTLNMRTLKSCEDALQAGTLFEELDLPFTGGDC